jgi:hypothetical protein
MASEARRQKQLARKKAKRQEKRASLARRDSNDPNIVLANASHWPILEALVPEDTWHSGLGQIVIARRHPDGRVACGLFLVDVFCLGVKNAHWQILPESEYETMKRKMQSAGGAFDVVTPEHLVKLVYGAVDFAQSFGFPPHHDYRHARMLLAGIDAAACRDIFEYGHEGKPMFVQGPYDSEAKVRTILDRLKAVEGDYVIGMRGVPAIGHGQPYEIEVER